MTASGTDTLRPGRMARYVVLLILAWMAVLTVRLYPQFETAVRVGGRVMTVDDYIADRCGTRLGPAAETCLVAARRKAGVQLRREQAKSVLIVVAPAVLYLLCLPLARAIAARQPRAAKRPKKAP
jgi:hypothetical protein